MAVADVERRRTTARHVAFAVFLLTWPLATWAVLALEEDPDPRPRTAPTTSTTSSTATTTSTTTTTPTPAGATPAPVPTAGAAPGAAAAENAGARGRSFSDRVTTPGVVLLAQLGVALLAAVLAAAAVQRAILGRYAFKIGTVELPEVDEADVEALKGTIDKVETDATAKAAAIARKLKQLEDRVRNLEERE